MRYRYVWCKDYWNFQRAAKRLLDNGYLIRPGTTEDGTYAIELLGRRGSVQVTLGI